DGRVGVVNLSSANDLTGTWAFKALNYLGRAACKSPFDGVPGGTTVSLRFDRSTFDAGAPPAAAVDGGGGGATPKIEEGGARASCDGRVNLDVIHRVARQHLGQFLKCYEGGLQSNPKLNGRVIVKFVVGADGSVSSAADDGSDLADKSVVQC